MNTNYFFESAYISPHGVQMYEYDKQSLDNRVDFAAFYHDDMWAKGLLNESSRELINLYNSVPLNGYERTTLGLEFDCGSLKPALFARLHHSDTSLNDRIFESVSKIVGVPNNQPKLMHGLVVEDIGIFPERESKAIRYLVRGMSLKNLKDFAIAQNCKNLDLLDTVSHDFPWLMGISFDWDGINIYNITFHSASLCKDDSWVLTAKSHLEEHVAKLFINQKYTISQFVKIGLSDTFHKDYMKAYFTVRYN